MGVMSWLGGVRSRPRGVLAEPRPAERAREGLRVRGLLDALPVAALVLDADGRIAEVNRAARARFSFLRPGPTLLEAFGERELAARAAAALRERTASDFEVRLFAEGRRTYRVSVATHDVDTVLEAVVVLTDATEAVAYQELRSQFVANVSHELRTPLTGLGALLEALEDGEMEPEVRANFIARARSETRRLEALISDILFLSELEANQGLPSRERADLSEAAHAAVEALAPSAADHGVVVRVDAPDPAWTPLTERMARTVVQNLLENAIKYAGPGATAQVKVAGGDGEVTVSVADDGIGIPERHLPHVFERFYRADPSRSKRLGGTGLGLSIVKHIAERFGGRAEATSRSGFGTTVRVVLPAASPGGPKRPARDGS